MNNNTNKNDDINKQNIDPALSSNNLNNLGAAQLGAAQETAYKIADHSADNKLPAPNVNTGEAQHTANQGGRLELLEERPVINKERLDVGKVTVSKHARTKTITVPVELIEEYITIQTDYSDEDNEAFLTGNYNDQDIVQHVEPTLDTHAVVTINGKQVQIGDEPIEIVISRQVAVITKDTHIIQEVDVSKTTHIHTDTIQVELKHEELDVQEEGFLEHESRNQLKK